MKNSPKSEYLCDRFMERFLFIHGNNATLFRNTTVVADNYFFYTYFGKLFFYSDAHCAGMQAVPSWPDHEMCYFFTLAP